MKIMQECFKLETQRLIKSWMQHDRGRLHYYLVQDVEDPRVNVQSILTRHFLIKQLFGDRFDDLMEHELRFSLVVNWLLGLLKKSTKPVRLHTLLDALLEREDEAEGIEIPPYVSKTFDLLLVPNYMCDLFSWVPLETAEVPIPKYLISTFQMIWREVLADEERQDISVLEPACGSANDYRFIDAFGIARLLNYAGFDLCEKNIYNSRQMFPNARFEVGNVLEIDDEDDTFDFCFVHDLFEHLSVEAMEAAIAEVCGITRKEICAGFFNMHDGPRHIIQTVRDYHWNKLSLAESKAVFEQYASSVQVIHVDTYLRSKFRCHDTHNKWAYTLIASK